MRFPPARTAACILMGYDFNKWRKANNQAPYPRALRSQLFADG